MILQPSIPHSPPLQAADTVSAPLSSAPACLLRFGWQTPLMLTFCRPGVMKHGATSATHHLAAEAGMAAIKVCAFPLSSSGRRLAMAF